MTAAGPPCGQALRSCVRPRSSTPQRSAAKAERGWRSRSHQYRDNPCDLDGGPESMKLDARAARWGDRHQVPHPTDGWSNAKRNGKGRAAVKSEPLRPLGGSDPVDDTGPSAVYHV